MTSNKNCTVHQNRFLPKGHDAMTLNSKLNFNFSSSFNPENNLIFRNTEDCEVAHNWILSLKKNRVKFSEAEISVPCYLYKSLIRSKEFSVSSIIKECGKISIHFPRNKSDLQKVVIKGPEENVEKAKKKLLQLVAEEQAKTYSVTIPVNSKYHQFLISEHGGNLTKICEKTGLHLIFPKLKNKDQEFVTIIGTEDTVKEVQKELEILLKDLENVVEDCIVIHRKFHHYFVMRRDQLLREMIEIYDGMSIDFTYEGKQSIRVTMKGKKACVEAAKKHIQQIFEPLGSHITTQYVIPQKFHPFYMGPMYSRIQQIGRDYKVQIKFPDREKSYMNIYPAVQETGKEKGGKSTKEPAYSTQRKCKTLLISGQVENCKAATETLESLIPVTAEVHVPFHLHPYIIGYKGSGIKKLMNEFEVHMQVLQPDGNSDIISIMGLAANVEQAQIRLQKQVSVLQAKIEEESLRNFKLAFTLDPKYRSKITGHKGLLIAQICTEHDVTIHFPKKGNHEPQDQIIITGYKENTLAARDAVMRMLYKIENTISKEIPLNHQVRGNIIGFGGKAIHRLMDLFQVDIRLPPKGSWNPNITVSGLPENVDEAIDHILSLEKHHLSALMKYESQLARFNSTYLYDIAMEPTTCYIKRDVPFNAKPTPNSPNIDNSEDYKSKHQTSPKTHPWRP